MESNAVKIDNKKFVIEVTEDYANIRNDFYDIDIMKKVIIELKELGYKEEDVILVNKAKVKDPMSYKIFFRFMYEVK